MLAKRKGLDRLIRIAAAITKEELEQVAQHYGATNAGHFAGQPAGTLRLVSFVGKFCFVAAKLLGEYQFEATDTPSEGGFDGLPGVESEPKRKRGPVAAANTTEEVTHV